MHRRTPSEQALDKAGAELVHWLALAVVWPWTGCPQPHWRSSVVELRAHRVVCFGNAAGTPATPHMLMKRMSPSHVCFHNMIHVTDLTVHSFASRAKFVKAGN